VVWENAAGLTFQVWEPGPLSVALRVARSVVLDYAAAEWLGVGSSTDASSTILATQPNARAFRYYQRNEFPDLRQMAPPVPVTVRGTTGKLYWPQPASVRVSLPDGSLLAVGVSNVPGLTHADLIRVTNEVWTAN
jgi:hypothetical protein